MSGFQPLSFWSVGVDQTPRRVGNRKQAVVVKSSCWLLAVMRKEVKPKLLVSRQTPRTVLLVVRIWECYHPKW